MQYVSVDAEGASSILEGAPENGDRTSDLSHRRAARTACQASQCRRAITCVYSADMLPRFEVMHGVLGPHRCGRGEAGLRAWRPGQPRVRAASHTACVRRWHCKGRWQWPCSPPRRQPNQFRRYICLVAILCQRMLAMVGRRSEWVSDGRDPCEPGHSPDRTPTRGMN